MLDSHLTEQRGVSGGVSVISFLSNVKQLRSRQRAHHWLVAHSHIHGLEKIYIYKHVSKYIFAKKGEGEIKKKKKSTYKDKQAVPNEYT